MLCCQEIEPILIYSQIRTESVWSDIFFLQIWLNCKNRCVDDEIYMTSPAAIEQLCHLESSRYKDKHQEKHKHKDKHQEKHKDKHKDKHKEKYQVKDKDEHKHKVIKYTSVRCCNIAGAPFIKHLTIDRYKHKHRITKKHNAITDGGVAPPPLLLTIVMMSSNLNNQRISRNFKDSIKG